MGKLTLTGKGRRWLASGHPWVYSDDVASGAGEAGELLAVEDPAGEMLGWGLHSQASKISVRMVTRSKSQPDRAFWKERMARAVSYREQLGYLDREGGCRLLAGDSEGIPGLVIDLYAGVAVLQCGTQATDRMREFLVELLRECMPFELTAVVDRSDTSVRKFEKLDPRVEVLAGTLPEQLIVREGDLQYEVDVLTGHKTGHYLDQRLNRIKAAGFAEGKTVLDAFSYDGLFGIRAALAGASAVTCLDQSREAGERLARNLERNSVASGEGGVEFVRAKAMNWFRDAAAEKRTYDLIVVDPPAFARNRREIEAAERGYVELNRRAMTMLAPGGRLVSASCSFNMRPEHFVRLLARAAREARREVFLDEMTGAAPDHPVLLTLPESHYLKCAFLRAV